jgi:phosphoesterase RecJ-like protein
MNQLLEAIQQYSSFVLTAHQSPDADGLAAEYALAIALRGMGKKCEVLNSDPTPERYAFIDQRGIINWAETADISKIDLEKTLCLVLDTNDRLNIGKVEETILKRTPETLFIDHHVIPPGDNSRGYLDPSASSTSEMVFGILEKLGVKIESDMALALFAGISYDTGSFIYQRTTERTFEVALALVRAGANPTQVHSFLHESASTSALLLMQSSLSSLELFDEARVAVQTLSAETFNKLQAHYSDAEDLINIPLQAKSVEVSVLFKVTADGTNRCSLRSKGKVNVANLAQMFGGGGHKTASGFKYSGSMEETREKLMDLIHSLLEGKELEAPKAQKPRRAATPKA